MGDTHIWVTQEFADKYNEATSDKAQLNVITEVIGRKSIDISSELEQLEEDSLRFKSACLQHKIEMQKVYDDQQEKIESLINSMWDVMPKAKDNAVKMAKEIYPVVNQVNELKQVVDSVRDAIRSIDCYGMDKFLEVAKTINSMDLESKEMLKFMMSNYKREQQ